VADNLDTIQLAVHAVARMLPFPGEVAKLEVERLESYPRIVWVSEGGTIEAIDDVGAGAVGTTRQRSVRTDAMAVQWHIWGEDREAARDMMHLLIYTCWEQARGSLEFGSYRYITEEDARGEFATHGSKILLEGAFRVPVTEAASDLTTISTATHTTDFVSDLDGSTETICP